MRGLRLQLGLAGVALGAVTLAGPADAKMPMFEVKASRTVIEVGQTVEVVARLTDPTFEAPGLEPPVALYRTEDLPRVGTDGVGTARPVRELRFGPPVRGVYRARVVVTEPGSYQLISMGVWNHRVVGYPEAIELRVVAAAAAEPVGTFRPVASESPRGETPWAVGAAALVGLAALAAAVIRRRRHPVDS